MGYLKRFLAFLISLLIVDFIITIFFQISFGISVNFIDSINDGISNIPFLGEWSGLIDRFSKSSTLGILHLKGSFKYLILEVADKIFKFALVTIIAFPITRITGLIFNMCKLWTNANSEGLFVSLKRSILGFILSVNSIYISTLFAIPIMNFYKSSMGKFFKNLYSVTNWIVILTFLFSIFFVVLAHSMLITAFMSLTVGKVLWMFTETIVFELANNLIVIFLLALITHIFKSPEIISTLVMLIIPFIGILMMLDLVRTKVFSRHL